MPGMRPSEGEALERLTVLHRRGPVAEAWKSGPQVAEKTLGWLAQALRALVVAQILRAQARQPWAQQTLSQTAGQAGQDLVSQCRRVSDSCPSRCYD